MRLAVSGAGGSAASDVGMNDGADTEVAGLTGAWPGAPFSPGRARGPSSPGGSSAAVSFALRLACCLLLLLLVLLAGTTALPFSLFIGLVALATMAMVAEWLVP